MTGSTPSQLEQAFRATEEQGSSGPGATRRRLLPHSGLDVFTEVRFPTRDWVLLVQSSEQLEDRDLVLAAGLTCRTSNGCIEVVAGPQTERQLFCTLLADLLAQLALSGNGPAAALARRLDCLAADAQPRHPRRPASGGAGWPVRRASRPPRPDAASDRLRRGERMVRPFRGTAGLHLPVHLRRSQNRLPPGLRELPHQQRAAAGHHRPGCALPCPPSGRAPSPRASHSGNSSTSCEKTRSCARTWHRSRTPCLSTGGLIPTAAGTRRTATRWPAGAATPSGTTSRGS